MNDTMKQSMVKSSALSWLSCLLLMLSLSFHTASAKLNNPRSSASLENSKSFTPEVVEYEDLLRFDQSSFQETIVRMRHALSEVGIVSIANVPGLSKLRMDVLKAASKCFLSQSKLVSKMFHERPLPDGAKYSTISSVEFGNLSSIPLDAYHPCINFQEKANAFDRLVKMTTHVFVSMLDDIAGIDEKNPEDSIKKTITEAIRFGQYSVYEQGTNQNLHEETLKLETENGLLLTFVPGISFADVRNVNTDQNMFIESLFGEVLKLDYRHDGNQLFIMMGAKAPRYFNDLSRVSFRAVPHFIRFDSGSKGQRKVWYTSAYLPKCQELQYESSNQTNSTDSFNKPRFTQLSERSCIQGEEYCGIQCMKVPKCYGSEKAVCAAPSGDAWNSSAGPCEECTIQCLEDEAKFCNGYPTSMYMSGFVFNLKNPNEACLVFLFESMLIDNYMKYVLAIAASFGAGFILEAMAKFRRNFYSYEVTRKYAKSSSFGVSACFFSVLVVEVALAYVAMLLAMTYSIYIFFAIVLGIGSGNILLTDSKRKSAARCCSLANSMESYNDESDLHDTLLGAL